MKQRENINPIKKINEGIWVQYTNNQGGEKSKYKLHIDLPPSDFEQYQEKIDHLLQEALNVGTIRGFKKNTQATADKDSKDRLYCNPFTIYLFEEVNFLKLAQLCHKIEALLVKTSKADCAALSEADIPLTERITFRQESLDDEKYIAIAAADFSTLEQLATEAKKSQQYQKLQAYCNDEQSSAADIAAYELVDFYNISYRRIEKKLNSAKITLQFAAACELLEIDKNHFQELKQKNDNGQAVKDLVRNAVKKYSLKTHPDKNLECKVLAEKLFKLELGNKAGALLNFLIDNPNIEVADVPGVELKQDAKKQVHQYELAEGFVQDPYRYVFMCDPEKKVSLRQYWEHKESKQLQISYGEDSLDQKEEKNLEEKSKILTVNIPGEQRVSLGPQGIKVELPGHEAFYHLFMSDALPYRFDSSHLGMCFNLRDDQKLDAKFTKQVLTTPKFIQKMHIYELIALARKATAQGIIAIGSRVDEIFLYYYRHFPETLHWVKKALDKDYAKEFNAKHVEDIILENSDLLIRLPDGGMDGMLQLSMSVCQFILNDKDLLKKMNHHWKYVFVEEFIQNGCGDLSPLEQMFINNLLLGQLSNAYPCLSLGCLNNLLSFLQQAQMTVNSFKINIPVWAINTLREELAAAKQRVPSSMILEEKDAIPSGLRYNQEIQIDYAYIKQQLWSATPNCTLLSETVLLTLAEDPDVHISFYYEIALALRPVNREKAEELLNQFKGKFPDISLSTVADVPEHKVQASLLFIRKSFRIEKLNALQYEWQNLVTKWPLDTQKILNIRRQLAWLADEKQAKTIHQAIERELDCYAEVYNNFCLYNIPEDKEERSIFKEKIRAYRIAYEHLSYPAKHPFSLSNSLLGNDAFQTLDYILDRTQKTPSNTLGIAVGELPVMVALERLFFFYDCLGEASRFYDALGLLTRIPGRSMPAELRNANTFDQQGIKKYLISYLDHELAIYFDGKRENVSYKTQSIMGMQIDQENIQSFSKLRSLYIGLGEDARYLTLLQQGCEKIKADKPLLKIKSADIVKNEPRVRKSRFSFEEQLVFPLLPTSAEEKVKPQALLPKSESPILRIENKAVVSSSPEEKKAPAPTPSVASKEGILREIKTLLMLRTFTVHYLISTSKGHEITNAEGVKNYLPKSAYNVYQKIQAFEKKNGEDYVDLFATIRKELKEKPQKKSYFLFWERDEKTTALHYKEIISILDKSEIVPEKNNQFVG